MDALLDSRLDVTGDVADWAKALPGGGGVYALSDEADRLVLLASGESLRRAITYRLAPPPEASRRRADLRSVVRRVRWRRTYSPFETAFEYHRAARIVLPDQYLEYCTFGPAWFVVVEPDACLPRLFVTKYLPSGSDQEARAGQVCLGPFPTRATAERFVETLRDLFDLCRYHHILEQTPQGEPCAYHEMGKCPAPCNGSITLERYRAMMRAAAEFGAGQWRAHVPQWEKEMHTLAGAQEFEKAGRIKQRIGRAAWLAGRDLRLVRPIERFSYLILQRGRGTTHIRPFFVRGGCVERGEEVSRRDLPEAAKTWLEVMTTPPAGQRDVDAALQSEWIWLVSHYLFKGEAAAGLFLGADEWPNVEAWLERARERIFRAGSSARGRPADPTGPDAPCDGPSDRGDAPRAS